MASPDPRPPHPRARRRREQLLAAAVAVFGERGYGATGIGDICAAASASVGTFYVHFDDKNAVVLELARRERARIAMIIARLDLVAERDRAELVAALLSTAGLRRAFADAELAASAIARELRQIRLTERELITRAFAQATTRGRHATPAATVAWMLLGLVDAAGLDHDDRLSERGDAIARLLDLVRNAA